MISGNMFTRDFLAEGIDGTTAWKALDLVEFKALTQRLTEHVAAFLKNSNPTEAETEKDLIWPILNTLGWSEMQVQQNLSTRGRKQVPDALLFADAHSQEKALAEKDYWKRYQYGTAIVEAKRWDRALDRVERSDRADDGVPSTQMLQYLSRVDVQTSGRLRHGILTNGRRWRLYFQGAVSVAEDFFEIDLAKALALPGFDLDLIERADERITPERALRLFILMFSKSAFLPSDGARTFHDFSREYGKTWEEKVAKDLSQVVFTLLFPGLVDALAKHDPQRPRVLEQKYLEEIRQSALVLLYRLLFVVYAEDRDLLPDQHEGYKPYSLTQLRMDIAEKRARKVASSDKISTYWPKLTAVFNAISEGDDTLGIPPYNGGLFSKDASPLLQRVQLPDSVIETLVYGLSHQEVGGQPKYINFRDLSVQQLGSIYERILEYGLKVDGDRVVVDADDAARHGSGSYYTPDNLVMLIIEKAVGPLVDERLAAFHEKALSLSTDRRPKAQRIAELSGLDPATRILELKICDPAMGSGHFLVSLVDWLADRVLSAMAAAEAVGGWADSSYHSPLSSEIVRVRTEIIRHAQEHKWPVVSEHLEDRHIVRRMILKRCVFGVDKNPMAVELAKVALWLHTFTVGAPLSFLDHHLRTGNSLFGYWVREAMEKVASWGGELLINEPMKRAMGAAAGMQAIERLTDADIAEVHRSKELFDGIESMTAPLDAFMKVLYAINWLNPKEAIDKAAIRAWLDQQFGDPIDIARGRLKLSVPAGQQGELIPDERPAQSEMLVRQPAPAEIVARFARILSQAHDLITKECIQSWQIAFPGVWRQWESVELQGGFDAVISNPPYVRQELLGEIKPALRRAFATSYDGLADLYVYFYEQGVRLLRPGGRLSYVVTNKWMRAGYAEGLRALFAEKTWVEFVADFGHAKKFFPDADVFPSVLVVRKPNGAVPPPETQVCVIPRDAIPEKGLSDAVAGATYALARSYFTRENWSLEPPEVAALLEKVRRNGKALNEYAGVQPLYGIKTGLNEAFLIDTARRDRLIAEDPSVQEFIKPYLRGQDINRWSSPDTGLFMIVMKSSSDHPWPWADAPDEQEAERRFKKTYPALYQHFKALEEFKDPKTGKVRGLRHREDQGRWWWELRPCAYYDAFEKPKTLYVDITWTPSFQIDTRGRYTNNTCYFLPTVAPAVVASLNAPIGWWYSWRKAQHGKDEALRYFTSFIETYPIAPVTETVEEKISGALEKLASKVDQTNDGQRAINDWLRHQFGIEKIRGALLSPTALDPDAFVTAVRACLPKQRVLTSAEIAELKREHSVTIEPSRRTTAEILSFERKLADMINEAYGLTAKEVQLMWDTAPPRMPFTPAGISTSPAAQEQESE